MDMKTIIIIFYIAVFPNICRSQFELKFDSIQRSFKAFKLNTKASINIDKERSLLLNSNNNKSFRYFEVNTVKSLAFANTYRNSARYTLFYDTLNTKSIIYDNYRKQYYTIDPFYAPYQTFENALMDGVINTLFNLFDQKK